MRWRCGRRSALAPPGPAAGPMRYPVAIRMVKTTLTVALPEPAVDATFDLDAWHRAWHGHLPGHHAVPAGVKDATLTITRDSDNDCQDRQVHIYVDGEHWGKVRYGQPMTRPLAPGPHKVRAFNTLLSHTVDVVVAPGEQVRLRCTNGLPKVGWLMLAFLHVTYLTVRLERV